MGLGGEGIKNALGQPHTLGRGGGVRERELDVGLVLDGKSSVLEWFRVEVQGLNLGWKREEDAAEPAGCDGKGEGGG